MYNKEIKSKFIADYTTSLSRRQAIKIMFDDTEQYETEWNKDICQASKDEVLPVLKKLVGFRTGSKGLRMSAMRGYIKWCVENGIPGTRTDILDIKDLGDEKMLNQTVANPQHLQRYLDCIFDKESEETIDCIYRAYYWVAYSGITEEEAMRVEASEVDFENSIIKHNGVDYPIYREAIQSLKKCVKLREVVYRKYSGDNKKVRMRRRTPGDILLRGISKEPPKIETMRMVVSRRARERKHMCREDFDNPRVNLKLSFYRVWLSGIFYRMCEAERAGIPVDFKIIVCQYYNIASYTNISRRVNDSAREFTVDYERWKSVNAV